MHKTVAHKDWTTARLAFLEKEKAFTRARDELSAARRALPWEKIEKTYVFEDGAAASASPTCSAARGAHRLSLHVRPGLESGLQDCTFWADNLERSVVHLNHRDTNLVLVSRRPIDKLLAYRKRFGWTMESVSSLNDSFNQDFAMSFAPDEAKKKTYNFGTIAPESEEMPGMSVFAKDGDAISHTYSTYARGIDMVNGTYQLLDLVTKGRDEDGLNFSMAWLRRRDEYEIASGEKTIPALEIIGIPQSNYVSVVRMVCEEKSVPYERSPIGHTRPPLTRSTPSAKYR